MSNWQEALAKDPVGSALLAQLIDKKARVVTFVIDPKLWHKAEITPPFNWSSVEFNASETTAVPEEPGLYAFVLKLPYPGLPPHGWIMYIGETGHGTSKHTLRDRFLDYLREQKKFKRAQTYFLLNFWKDELHFFYTKLPARKHELKALETQLLDAFRPPYSRGGYSASLNAPQSAY